MSEMEFNHQAYTAGAVRSSRGMLVLHWLCEQVAARYDHLEALTDMGKTQVSMMVRELRESGYVQARRIMLGEHMWVFPTPAGIKACGLTYNARRRSLMSLPHVAAINDVRLHIQRNSEQTDWISERRLYTEPTPGVHVPDGLAIYEGRRVAIEVELTIKKTHLVRAKLDAMEPRFDAVLYFCAPAPFGRMTKLMETGHWPNLGVRELPKLKRGPDERG